MKDAQKTTELLRLILLADKERCITKTEYKKRTENVDDDCSREIAELKQTIVERDVEIRLLKNSTSFKVGNALVRFAKKRKIPALSVVNYSPHYDQFVPGPWRASPRRVRGAYRSAAKSSPLLRTVSSPPDQGAASTDRLGDVHLLWQTLQSRREGAPRVLDDFERGLLASVTAARPQGEMERDEDLMQLIDAVRSGPVREGRVDGAAWRKGKGRLLIDARTLQGGRLDGTARHAATVIESVLARQDHWEGVSLLIDDARPPVPASLVGTVEQRGLDTVTPDLVSRTAAFLQLQPFHDLRHCGVFDELLMAPWIRTATVWLDAIVGTYPRHFLPGPQVFFSYQWFVERLRHYDHVLALSDTARNEVLPLVADAERITVTGCRNPLGSYRQLAQKPRHGTSSETHVSLFGNPLPHKNIAAGLFAFAYAHARYSGKLRLDVVANLPDEYIHHARGAMRSLDTRLPAAVTFHRRLSDFRLSVLLANASATIVPSFHEGFSLPVLESFDFGVPVVASAIPAHRELVGPDYPLAPPNDPVALGRNLLEALDSPAAWTARLKEAPVSRSEAQFEAGMADFLDRFCRPRGT